MEGPGTEGAVVAFVGSVQPSGLNGVGWGCVKHRTCRRSGVGGVQVMAAPEGKRVPAAPGALATNGTVLVCKREYRQLIGTSRFTVGKLRPWQAGSRVTS